MNFSFKRDKLTLQGFSNASLGGDLDGRKSITFTYFCWVVLLLVWSVNSKVEFHSHSLKQVTILEVTKEMICLNNLFK